MGRVLGVVDVLAEGGKAIHFVVHTAVASSIDEFSCIAKVVATVVLVTVVVVAVAVAILPVAVVTFPVPRWFWLVTFVLVPGPLLLLTRSWLLIGFLIAPWYDRGVAVARS